MNSIPSEEKLPHFTTMATAVGSSIFFAVSLIVICLLVLLLLRYYLPLRTTPAHVLIPVFLAVALPSSIILLVPIDLASSAQSSPDGVAGIFLGRRVLLVSWRISYWLTFVLTWVSLPILGEYVDSGHRDIKGRLLYSLKSNATYHLIVLAAGVLGAIYFFITKGFSYTSLKGLVMALAYAWGLILAIYLMGHGLVAIPRKLFRDASISGRLRRLQMYAPKIHENLMDATDELDSYEQQVQELKRRKNATSRDFQDWIDELVDMISVPDARIVTAATLPTSRPNVPDVITERYLADLSRRLKRARHKKIRYVAEWDYLVQKATRTQTILDSATTKQLSFGATPPYAPWYEKISLLTPRLRYHLYMHVMPACYYFMSAILAMASVCIIWSELVKGANGKLCVVGLTVVHPYQENYKIGFASQFLAALWLGYMCASALWSISEVKVWGNRALVRRNTYLESACWYAAQVAKLTVPLAYNFLEFTPPDVQKKTVFYTFLGELINLTPLGNGFTNYFPAFVLIPVLASLFNLYSRVKTISGFGDLMDEEDELGGWREGRSLIERELRAGRSGAVGLRSSLDLVDDGSRDVSPMPPQERTSASALAPSAPSTTVATSTAATAATAERAATAATASTASRPARAPRNLSTERQPLAPSYGDDEAEEGPASAIQDFAHRVKNTFDTRFAGLTEGLKMPKWMNGQDGNGGLGRWFGRPPEGRVRL